MKIIINGIISGRVMNYQFYYSYYYLTGNLYSFNDKGVYAFLDNTYYPSSYDDISLAMYLTIE